MRKKSAVSLATALAFATMITFSACGTNNSSTSVGTSPGQGSFNGPGPASQAVVTAGDAPMAGVLAAQVTIGSVTAANANGTTTALLLNPATVELSSLGTGQTILDVNSLPQGTYNSITFTVTGANFTYMNAGTVTYATSTPPATTPPTAPTVTIPKTSQSLTYTFATPMVVNYQNASLLNLDFNLAQELDLTSGMVTFTPTVTVGTTAGNVAVSLAAATGLNTAQATVHVYGTVASTNGTNNSLVLTTDAVGYGETVYLNTTPATLFNGTLGLGNLAVGARARVVGTLNPDGSLEAISVESADNGAAEIPVKGVTSGSVNNGVVTATSASGFTMVVTNSSVAAQVGLAITVNTSATTVYAAAAAAAGAGQTATFAAAQIFPGQAVWVAGTTDAKSTATAVIVDATNVNQSAVSLQAKTTGAPTATIGSDKTTVTAYVFPLSTSFSNLASGTAVTGTALTCGAVGGTAPTGCLAANLDGPYLQFGASPAPPTEPTGDIVTARGYLTLTSGAYSLALTDINDPAQIPPPPPKS